MAVKVNSKRKNPEEVEVDAFAEDGVVVVKIGGTEIAIEPADAERFADLIAESAVDAEEGVDTFGDEEEEEGENLEHGTRVHSRNPSPGAEGQGVSQPGKGSSRPAVFPASMRSGNLSGGRL